MSGPATRSGSSREIWLRIVSGLALAAVALSLTVISTWSFAILAGGVALIVAWEWGRVVRDVSADAALAVTGVAIVAAVVLTALGLVREGLAVLLGGALFAAISAGSGSAVQAAVGAVYAGLPALAMVWLRASEPGGLEAILLLMLVVWATDSGAFAAGRSLGGPKLWPRVSPNKTWSGLIGGVAAAGVVAWVVARSVGSAAPGRVVAIGLALGLVSQAGDLLESAIKRRRGVKDASHLIPGHGGFMDRVDGLVLAALAAALYGALLAPDAPASVLLARP